MPQQPDRGRHFEPKPQVLPDPSPRPSRPARRTPAQLRQDGYRDGARDARIGVWNPDSLRYRSSKNYREGYGQAHTDHHKIGPAPLAKAAHLRGVQD